MRVLNLHALSLALRPPVVVGEDVVVQLIKPGREAGQGVGYLDDGTMVVVERGKALVGKDVTVRVTSVVITANGRLVFAHVSGSSAAAAHCQRMTAEEVVRLTSALPAVPRIGVGVDVHPFAAGRTLALGLPHLAG